MNLYAVQEIVQAHSDSIWIAKFSPCGNFLATGGKDAVLKIWKVKKRGSDITELVRQQVTDLFLFENVPKWELREHAEDIVDISWSLDLDERNEARYILSCSFDLKVILWDLKAENNFLH